MSPEAQRIAIAEACGIVSKDKWGSLYKTPRGILRDCPDYLADKNAMQIAKQTLWDKGLMLEFVNQLVGIVCSAKGFRWDKLTTDDHLMLVANATAEQEAEAFLRTLGKWEGAK